MIRLSRLLFTFAFLATAISTASAGIYSGPTDTTNAIDPAIASTDARFVQWANAIDATRTSFSARGNTMINQGLGPNDSNSLGDLTTAEIDAGNAPGFLTVTFPDPIRNGSGPDFAVFENGFTFGFSGRPDILLAELAYVEVSTNGSDFLRFPSVSTNLETDLLTTFGRQDAGLDSSNIFNLAGKHADGFGTPFDLDQLSGETLVTAGVIDLNNIQFVKLVDIPGEGSFLDSEDRPILDPHLTSVTGGFDFRLGEGLGIGVLNSTAIPEPGSLIALSLCCVATIGRRRRQTSSNR